MTTLLLVEDDTSLGETLELRLAQEGYTVLWAKDCTSAELFLREHAIDLAILDVGLPDSSGFTFAREVRERTKIPFIFLTAMNSAEYRLEAFEIGAADYIPKPFHLKELLLRISLVLERQRSKKISITPRIVIDPDDFSAHHDDGAVIFLAQREFEVLQFLVSEAPRVISREEILKKVFRVDDLVSPRTVDNAIVKIRQALKDQETYLRSIRGVGYKWMGTLII